MRLRCLRRCVASSLASLSGLTLVICHRVPRGSQVPDDKVADVAAPVRGVSKDTLVGEHLRQNRRTVRLARSAVAVLAILTVLAVTASVIAARAARASDIAAQAAVSGELAAQSEVVAATNSSGMSCSHEISWPRHAPLRATAR
jgi:hypothetical protein